jgi:hypothetical protein
MRLPVSKPTLIDVPVSNHGARVRHIIYQKGLEGEFDIVSPMELGGLGSEQYIALNPQNKMPILLLPNGQTLPESEVCDINIYTDCHILLNDTARKYVFCWGCTEQPVIKIVCASLAVTAALQLQCLKPLELWAVVLAHPCVAPPAWVFHQLQLLAGS